MYIFAHSWGRPTARYLLKQALEPEILWISLQKFNSTFLKNCTFEISKNVFTWVPAPLKTCALNIRNSKIRIVKFWNYCISSIQYFAKFPILPILMLILGYKCYFGNFVFSVFIYYFSKSRSTFKRWFNFKFGMSTILNFDNLKFWLPFLQLSRWDRWTFFSFLGRNFFHSCIISFHVWFGVRRDVWMCARARPLSLPLWQRT